MATPVTGEQGPYLRSLKLLDKSSEAKKCKNIKHYQPTDQPTNQPTDGQTEKRVVESRRTQLNIEYVGRREGRAVSVAG